VDELAKPKRHIRPPATLEHGITDEMVDHAPRWGEILPQVEDVLARKKVVVYDLPTELLVLKNSYQNYHHRWALDQTNFFDLMNLFSWHKNERDPRTGMLKVFSLEQASCLLGIDIEIIGYRRAREDAWLMRALLLAIAGWKVYY
jgi:DNA polymerase III epsilon subunit-like protein